MIKKTMKKLTLILFLLIFNSYAQSQSKTFVKFYVNVLEFSFDEKAQDLWDVYTTYKSKMFENTKEGSLPWRIIRANKKTYARVAAISHILKSIPYDKKKEI